MQRVGFAGGKVDGSLEQGAGASNATSLPAAGNRIAKGTPGHRAELVDRHSRKSLLGALLQIVENGELAREIGFAAARA